MARATAPIFMRKIDKDIGLYLIIDSGFTKDFTGMTKSAVDAGLKIIQYRDKNAGDAEMIENAVKMRELTQKSDTMFIVNDNVDVAVKSRADGVHVGHNDAGYEDVRRMLPGGIIGVSVDNMEQALLADKTGADYLGVGPVFPTATKPDAAPPLGVEKLAEIVRAIAKPVVAIGGINPDNLQSVLGAGVGGVAVISAILSMSNPAAEMRKIVSKIEEFRNINCPGEK